MFGVRASSIRPVFSIPSTITALTYGVAYSETLSITESYVSDLGNYSFVRTSGTLPAGITLTTAAKSFTLSGTPTSKSSFTFTITASLLGKSYAVTYTGTPSVTKITASGGAIAFDYNGYRVHAFTASSNFVVSSGCDDVEVMLLSGGGGGRGDGNGGGGGGGGGKWVTTVNRVGTSTNAVTIGAGGAAGSNGTASSVLGVFSPGGGGGGVFGSVGNVGGSGGGGGGFASGGIASSNGVGFTQTTGFNGGAGGFYNGGGGGGMGGLGNNGNANPNETGGYGGSGQTTPFVTGWQDPATSVGRGGGGGGGGGNGGGVALGGAGGGEGRGNAAGGVGQNAAATYGAGGGGGYLTGGQGSSGFVWIRYPL